MKPNLVTCTCVIEGWVEGSNQSQIICHKVKARVRVRTQDNSPLATRSYGWGARLLEEAHIKALWDSILYSKIFPRCRGAQEPVGFGDRAVAPPRTQLHADRQSFSTKEEGQPQIMLVTSQAILQLSHLNQSATT